MDTQTKQKMEMFSLFLESQLEKLSDLAKEYAFIQNKYEVSKYMQEFIDSHKFIVEEFKQKFPTFSEEERDDLFNTYEELFDILIKECTNRLKGCTRISTKESPRHTGTRFYKWAKNEMEKTIESLVTLNTEYKDVKDSIDTLRTSISILDSMNFDKERSMDIYKFGAEIIKEQIEEAQSVIYKYTDKTDCRDKYNIPFFHRNNVRFAIKLCIGAIFGFQGLMCLFGQ